MLRGGVQWPPQERSEQDTWIARLRASLADAMTRLARRKEIREGDVFAWFQEWVAAGMFSRVEVS